MIMNAYLNRYKYCLINVYIVYSVECKMLKLQKQERFVAIQSLKLSAYYLLFFYLASLVNAQITSPINTVASIIEAIYVFIILYNDITINNIEISICKNGEYKFWVASFIISNAIAITIINITIA